MFANKYQISYECEVFSREAALRRLYKPLILHVYGAHNSRCSVVQYATFTQLSVVAKTAKSRHCRLSTQIFFKLRLCLSRLYHSLECYTRVYTTTYYGITYLFCDRRARANMGLRSNSAINWSCFSGAGYVLVK